MMKLRLLRVLFLLTTIPLFAQSSPVITVDNAADLATTQVLGLGYIYDAVGWWGDEIVLITTTGLWFFDPDDLNAPPRPLRPDGTPRIANPYRGMDFGANLFVGVDGDDDLQLLTPDGTQWVIRENLHWRDYTDLAVSLDGSRIAVTTRLGISVTDVASGQQIQFLRVDGGATGLALSPDNTHVASFTRVVTDNARDVYICPIDEQGCDSPDTIRLNLPPDADEKLTWDDRAVSIAISNDGQYLAAVFIRGLAGLWRLSDGTMLGYTYLAQSEPLASLRFKVLFSPDSKWLAVTNNMKDEILLWEAAQGLDSPEQVISPDDPAYHFVDMVFSPDSRKLVYQSWIDINQIQALVVWDIVQGVETQRHVIRGYGGRGVFIAQKTPWLLATGNTSLAVWDSQQGAILDTLRTPERITETTVAEVGTTLHSASFIGDSVLPCRFEGSEFACDELLRHSDLVQGAQFSEDAKTLVTVSADGVIRHWDLAQRLVTQAVEIPPYPTDTVATLFSSDFSRLVTGGGPYNQPGDNTIRLWDTTSGQLLREFTGQATRVTGLAFSPDEMLLASIDDHSILRLWNVETGAGSQPVGTPPERLWNEFLLPTATFSPDGTLIAISQGNTAHLLSVTDVMQLTEPADTLYLTTLTGHSHRVRGLTFSADGTRLYTTGWDDTVRVWQVPAP